jgi:plasmid maintenance system antidote protein VapI
MLTTRGWETNKKAAVGLGVSTFTINELYHGRPVSPGTIVKVANVLGVDPMSIASYTSN